MPIPDSPRVIYGNNPLREVICQLRFPTILAISADSPVAFQEVVRRAGYPIYETDAAGEAEIPSEVTQRLRIEFVPVEPDHRFSSEDAKRMIALSKDFLAVTDRNYREWSDFRDDLLELARQAFEAQFEPTYYSRVGLRYRNIVKRAELGLEDVPWSELVNPSLAGILGDKHVSEDISTLQATVLLSLTDEVEGGQLRLRHGLVTASPEEAPAYLVDADFYVQDRRNPDDVPTILATFNELAGRLFRWAITPRLHEVLDPA